jgi:dodecin
MSVAKVIEISAESKQGFEDAINQGVTTAAKSIRNIKGGWVKEQQVVIEDGKIVTYRVNMQLTFVLE